MSAAREQVSGVPGDELRGLVLGYRGFRFGTHATRRRLVVPDGVVKVMLGFGSPMDLLDAVRPRRLASAVSLVNGLRTTATIGQHHGLLHGITVLLTPPAAYRLFGIPLGELGGLSVDLADLLPRSPQPLTERLVNCRDWPSRFALLDAALAARMRTGPECSPEVTWAWEELRRTAGQVRVTELASATGWSRRHLERRFREQIGATPKESAQILRLQAALRLERAGLPWALAAAGAGYHDQPHFDHTFKAMIGRTPGSFRTGRAAGVPEDPLDFLPEQVSSILLAR